MSYQQIEIDMSKKLIRDKTWDFQLKSFDKNYKPSKEGTLHVLTLAIGNEIRWISPYFDELLKEQNRITYNAAEMFKIIKYYITESNVLENPDVSYSEKGVNIHITIHVSDKFADNTIRIKMRRQDHLERKIAPKVRVLKGEIKLGQRVAIILMVVFTAALVGVTLGMSRCCFGK